VAEAAKVQSSICSLLSFLLAFCLPTTNSSCIAFLLSYLIRYMVAEAAKLRDDVADAEKKVKADEVGAIPHARFCRLLMQSHTLVYVDYWCNHTRSFVLRFNNARSFLSVITCPAFATKHPLTLCFLRSVQHFLPSLTVRCLTTRVTASRLRLRRRTARFENTTCYV
jgi:hypothetical protein